MPANCLLYYITDRTAFAGDESSRRRRLVEKIAEAARAGVDYIQLREKDLSTRDLELLAKDAVSAIRQVRLSSGNSQPATAFLINSRTDVALAVQADGVHLRSDDVSPEEVRAAWTKRGAGAPFDKLRAGSARQNLPQAPIVAVSCHSAVEVVEAAASAARFAVFGPVFQKHGVRPAGLELLREACLANIPVLALGGITLENASSCLAAGAAGIAAIRLFQENDMVAIVKQLRG
jgi:thiamine-phosphate pyrophosphorylase